MFPNTDFDFSGVSVHLDISDQPLNNEDTFQGALVRVENAKIEFIDADYWVGIEGGIQKIGDEMESFAWVVVQSSTQIGKSRTGTFFLPKQIVHLINQGKELGEADDIVFNRTNSKLDNGTIGILTDNVIDRTKYYLEAVVLSLIPFKNEHLY